MRIIYISNSRIPTEKAYGVSVVKTCEALANMRINTGTGRIFTDKSVGLLHKDLTYKIRGAVFEVYNALGFGHKESAYQKAMEHEFKKTGIPAEPQKNIDLIYDKKIVGTYRPDFVIDNKVIIELKSSRFLTKEDKQQAIHYLKSTNYKLALLINFGAPKLQIERIINTNLRESNTQIDADSKQIFTDGSNKNPNESKNNPRESELHPCKSEKIEVLLLAPRVKNNTEDDIFSYYGIQKNFSIRYIPTLDAVTAGWRYGFLVNQISFGIAVFFLYFKKRDAVIITRDEVSGFLFRLVGFPVYYDMHGFPERFVWLWKILLKPLSGIITTNNWKIEQCHKNLGIPREKMIVARNGFDPKLFLAKDSFEALRKRLHLPLNRPIVLYTGHLYDWKGVYVLAETARAMPRINFVFVGGTYYHRADFEKKYNGVANIVLVGQKPYQEIPLYLKAADILVLPNSAVSLGDARYSVYTRHDTSPIKVFEYMASGVPIVSSDLPSIREILNEKNAVLVKSDSPEDLKRGIEKILNDKKTVKNISKQALQDVKEYTWDKRAEKIIAFLNKSC